MPRRGRVAPVRGRCGRSSPFSAGPGRRSPLLPKPSRRSLRAAPPTALCNRRGSPKLRADSPDDSTRAPRGLVPAQGGTRSDKERLRVPTRPLQQPGCRPGNQTLPPTGPTIAVCVLTRDSNSLTSAIHRFFFPSPRKKKKKKKRHFDTWGLPIHSQKVLNAELKVLLILIYFYLRRVGRRGPIAPPRREVGLTRNLPGHTGQGCRQRAERRAAHRHRAGAAAPGPKPPLAPGRLLRVKYLLPWGRPQFLTAGGE